MSDFIHLHNHSDFSLLDGAASIKSLVSKASSLGMSHLALTDHGNMFGALNFYRECISQDIKPIVGCEFYVASRSRHDKGTAANPGRNSHLILLAKDVTGYRNLIKLTSAGYTEGFYYRPRIDYELIERHAEGLICLSSCLAGEIPYKIVHGDAEGAARRSGYLSELFGKDNFFLELQNHGIPEQKVANDGILEIAKHQNIKYVATNDAHYTNRDDANAQDILICIGTNKKKNESGRMHFYADEFYLKTQEEMAASFSAVPEALSNTLLVAEQCDLEIPLPGPLLPDYDIPEQFKTPEEYLRYLSFNGLKERYKNTSDALVERMEYELDVIISMGFTGYFLIVWDFIHFARENNIPVGPGRGSGVSSIVAYSLKITDIDPLKYNLLFERFMTSERVSMPDFDIDFCYERRQEVIDYVTEKYGSDRVGQIITFGTLKARAVLRDVSRVLDLPYAEADTIAKLVPPDLKMTLPKALDLEPRLQELRDRGGVHRELIESSLKLEGLARHASTHAAGIVIGKEELTNYVPLYRDAKTGAISTQYDKDILEDCGLVKMDFLGLKTLTLIKNTVDLIRKREPDFDIEDVPDDDEATFALLGEGKSTCVFQFESSGMQGILKRAKPGSIEDLIALNSLYRPGPMAFIDQYVDSKLGKKPIKYPLPELEPILKETYGVIVYQEQVMEIARKVGGYTLGQADILRRVMGKKKAEAMNKEKVNFLAGSQKLGYTKKVAEEIFDLLVPFAGYGFNKSHAAAYSVLAYKTAYLKANYPAEFMAANLTNEITSTDKLREYIAETHSMGLEILPPDINLSEKHFTVVDGKIVYGIMGIKNVGSSAVDEIVRRRADGPYTSFIEFLERVDLKTVNRKVIETLIQSGLFDTVSQNRATLIENLDMAIEFVSKKKEWTSMGQSSLFDEEEHSEFRQVEFVTVDDWPSLERLRLEKENLGFYISGHPLDENRRTWEKTTNLNLAKMDDARSGKEYTLLGLVSSTREISTKNGRRMAFVQIEDFQGTAECIVFSDQWEQYGHLLREDAVVGIQGKIDASRGDPKIIAEKVMSPEEMKEIERSEIHIRLTTGFSDEEELYGIRSFLIENGGESEVFLHIPLGLDSEETVVKASTQIGLSQNSVILEKLKGHAGVSEVWKE